MKKFKLVPVNEWSLENISNPLDESISQILIKDMPQDEKILAYKELVMKYQTPVSHSEKILAETENCDNSPFTSKQEKNSTLNQGESELQGAGDINIPENKGGGSKENIETISNSYSVLPISHPPGIQISNWRKLWIDL